MAGFGGVTRRTALLAAGAAALPRIAFAEDKVLRAGIAGFNTINTLDPGKASLNPEFFIIYGIFNGLLKFDADMKIVPDLAESYKVVDPTILEFKLRSGVTFHDGSPLSADDVNFTFERIADRNSPRPAWSRSTRSPRRGRRPADRAHPHQGPVRAAADLPDQYPLRHADRAAGGGQADRRRGVRPQPGRHRPDGDQGLEIRRRRAACRLPRLLPRRAENRRRLLPADRRGVERPHRGARAAARFQLRARSRRCPT